MQFIPKLARLATFSALISSLIVCWYWASAQKVWMVGALLVAPIVGFVLVGLLLLPAGIASQSVKRLAASESSASLARALNIQSLLTEAAMATYVVIAFLFVGRLTSWMPVFWTAASAVHVCLSPSIVVARQSPRTAYAPQYMVAVTGISILAVILMLIAGTEPENAIWAAPVVFGISSLRSAWKLLHVQPELEQVDESASEELSMAEVLKLQFEMGEAMTEMGDGVETNHFPNSHGPFGLTPENPIPCKSIVGCHAYLDNLRAMDGTKVTYRRSHSVGSSVSKMPVDAYTISDSNDHPLETLYLSPYQRRNSRRSPPGFLMRRG